MMKGILSALVGIVLISSLGCGPGQRTAGFDASLEWAALKKQEADLNALRAQIGDLRASLARWEQEKRAPGTFKPGELPDKSPEMLTSRLDTMENVQLKGALTAFWDHLTMFLSRVLNNPKFKSLPESQKALRLYADETLFLARQAVERDGNYGQAQTLLQQALHYEKDDPSLVEEMARVKEFRYLTRKHFDALAKGMGMDQAKSLCGVPNPANIRDKREKGHLLTAWFYLREDQETAALFFEDGRLYATQWDTQNKK